MSTAIKSNEEIELSVVVLSYKSEDVIEKFVAQLLLEASELSITYELILVANFDKNTKDNTPDLAYKIANQNEHIRIVSSEKEGGMGWDMRSGLAVAKGKYIAVIDGDAQMPASDIPIVYGVIKLGKHDIVKTYRAKRYDGLIRSSFSYIYNILFRVLFSPTFPVQDINSKPKIFTQEAYQKMNLSSNDWFTDAEIMIEAIKHKMKICEISTVFYKNERRTSFVDFNTVFEFIYNLFYYRVKK